MMYVIDKTTKLIAIIILLITCAIIFIFFSYILIVANKKTNPLVDWFLSLNYYAYDQAYQHVLKFFEQLCDKLLPVLL